MKEVKVTFVLRSACESEEDECKICYFSRDCIDGVPLPFGAMGPCGEGGYWEREEDDIETVSLIIE